MSLKHVSHNHYVVCLRNPNKTVAQTTRRYETHEQLSQYILLVYTSNIIFRTAQLIFNEFGEKNK